MWKSVNGRLIQTVDDTRAEYKTRISKSLLTELKKLADEHNTHVGYLLETGFVQILKENYINFDKKTDPRIELNSEQHVIKKY